MKDTLSPPTGQHTPPPKTKYGTREYIAAARAVLNPLPVRLEHVPAWLKKRILAKWKPSRYNSRKGFYVVRGFCESRGIVGFLDHWGSITFSTGEVCFVSEPYMSMSDVDHARQFAAELGIDVQISSNSHWFPGNTVRLIFREPRTESGGCK